MKTLNLLNFILLLCVSSAHANTHSLEQLRIEIKSSLEKDIVDIWYPKVVDTEHGGFLSKFDQKWNQVGEQNKMLITQSRHVWTTIRLSQLYPNKPYLKTASDSGLKFILKNFKKNEGGFYWHVDKMGHPLKSDQKNRPLETYSHAFLIYALAAYSEITENKEALQAAKETFWWLEKNHHDPEFGGYYNWHVKGEKHSNKLFVKGQNTTIHLMEAFAELYRVWNDPLLKKRLTELYDIITQKMIDKHGYTKMYFDRDWTPQTLKKYPQAKATKYNYIENVSFGHDVEIAYLLLDAQSSLGKEQHAPTLNIAKKLLDHSLNHAWDKASGGLFESGRYNGDICTVTKAIKTWWVQAENLNTLILLMDEFPQESYQKKAFEQWGFIKNIQIDSTYGGWHDETKNGKVLPQKTFKSHGWKATYHNGRALMNAIAYLTKD